MAERRTAILYRMILPDHTCPYGVRAHDLLEAAGYDIDDRILSTRDQVEAVKSSLGVVTTPQIFIEDEHVGGCSELEQWLLRS